jgi:hypothetical protein
VEAVLARVEEVEGYVYDLIVERGCWAVVLVRGEGVFEIHGMMFGELQFPGLRHSMPVPDCIYIRVVSVCIIKVNRTLGRSCIYY